MLSTRSVQATHLPTHTFSTVYNYSYTWDVSALHINKILCFYIRHTGTGYGTAYLIDMKDSEGVTVVNENPSDSGSAKNLTYSFDGSSITVNLTSGGISGATFTWNAYVVYQ